RARPRRRPRRPPRPSAPGATDRAGRSRRTSRSTPSPRSRAAIAGPGRASRGPRRRGRGEAPRSRLHPAVGCDRNELVERRLELGLRRMVDPVAQHLEDLPLRTAVHEDDEAEAVPLLVVRVEPRELLEDDRVGVRALLRSRARGQTRALPDGRVRVEDLALLVGRKLVDAGPCPCQRVGLRREPFDEARPPFEQLRELVRAQLPRYLAHPKGETRSGTW